jgi:hypothetical protein
MDMGVLLYLGLFAGGIGLYLLAAAVLFRLKGDTAIGNFLIARFFPPLEVCSNCNKPMRAGSKVCPHCEVAHKR